MKPPPTPTPRVRFAQAALALMTALRAEMDDPTLEIYWRALKDIPIKLLEDTAIELAATAKFMPRPAEWREAVDELLDRRERLQALAGPSNQPALPGEIGDGYVCEDCENSGWVTTVTTCLGTCKQADLLKPGHTHSQAARCTNKFCVQARAQAAARKQRYAKTRE